jgi:hypothetical protein
MKRFQLSGIALAGAASLLMVAISAPQSANKKTVPTKPAANSGEAMFAQKCAPCHGEKGVGGGGFSKPLTGTRTASDLSKYIASSMPPGGKTPPAQAELIANYMHDAFYSPIAQERIRPPRVTMARLTVKQFRNSLADLIGPEHPAIVGEPGGLTGSYFKSQAMDTPNRLLDRLDPSINFDFGTKGPSDKPFDLHNFSISWVGSIYAPETGDYEFIVRSNQATVLFLNGMPKPVVDGRVRSVNETEMRGTIYLVGGRSYPLNFIFTKTTTGVNDDEKKKKIPPGPANVQLLWRRPKLTAEIIPSSYLIPAYNQPSYICETPFPADDRSIGYERGTGMTKEWDDATTQAALLAADFTVANWVRKDGIKTGQTEKIETLKQGLKGLIQKAFRQPLTPEQEQIYITKQFAANPNPEIAVKRSILLALKSPRFLYREIGNRKDPYQTAAELAFGLWDTLPDNELLRAAGAGEMKTAEGFRRQADRMVNDPRSWQKLRDFLMLWLKVDDTPHIAKNEKAFPKFDQATVTDLKTSLDLFLKDAAWGPTGSYQKLLLSNRQFFNGRLSELYGAGLPAGAPFQPVTSQERVGVLTHPYLLSRFSYLESTSPIHRGVLVVRSMMGRMLAPPPVAVAPAAASLHPSLTTRERVIMQTKPDGCNGCHNLINPLGFTLEKYDAIGKVRTTDNNKPLDTNGWYQSPSTGATTKFSNAEDLAKFIAASDEAQLAFVEKLFQHITKQPIRAYGKNALPNLHQSFKKNNFNINSLMVSILMTTYSNQP